MPRLLRIDKCSQYIKQYQTLSNPIVIRLNKCTKRRIIRILCLGLVDQSDESIHSWTQPGKEEPADTTATGQDLCDSLP